MAVINRLLLTAVLALPLMGCGEGARPDDPNGGNTVSVAQAHSLYVRKCSLCHGDDGKLGASKSPDLSVSGLDFKERVALITYGKGTMPGQKGILQKEEIEAVARYIEQFRE